MPSFFESQSIRNYAKPFKEVAAKLEILFPNMEWDLKKAGISLDPPTYLSVILYMMLFTFVLSMLGVVTPIAVVKGASKSYPWILFSISITLIVTGYLLFIPRTRINRRGRLIDKDLDYMLKDIKIQLRSGVPLFDTIVNIGRGQYGECSTIASDIVKEVQSGKSIVDVLNEVGMLSPSDYLRKVLWQIVNAVRSGADVVDVLEAISGDIRADKEAKIKEYGKELNLYSLLYMIVIIIMPSMGVTLMVILSSFIGGRTINEQIFWIILLVLIIIQVFFITFIKEKRPIV